MSLILQASDGREIKVNAWNWGVLHHVVASARVLPEEVWQRKRYNGGGELAPAELAVLAGFLEREVLPRLRPGERLLANGEVSTVPDDGTFHRAPDELWKNYSLQRSVLVQIIDFLRSAKGDVSFL